ncbi:MAG: hypothetical protein JWN15_465, partial [Firmicutes bacterium]|nr:hypothetical protein [Bacillota bacterium]
ATDAVGNESAPLALTIVRDSVDPILTGLTLTVKRAAETEELPPVSGTTYAFATRGADAYTLAGSLNEKVAAVLIGGQTTGVQLAEQGFTITLPALRNGSNSFDLTVTDLAGNATRVKVTVAVDAIAPSVTVSTPAGSLLLGKPPTGEQTRAFEFTGTASEPLKALRVVDAATGQALTFPVTVTINPRDAKKWVARIILPTTDAASWAFRFSGEDQAGNVSAPNSQGKDRRTVTIDPQAPTLRLGQPDTLLIYTSGSDAAALQGQLKVSGTLTDPESGVKQVIVGKDTIAPKGTVQSFDFTKLVKLEEGKVTVIQVYGRDLAGNVSESVTIRALLKTAIKTPKVTAQWSVKNRTLSISGSTDSAVSLDGAYVAVVPLTISIMDNKSKQVVRTISLDSVQRAGYNVAKGTFAVTLSDLNDLPDGSYTVTVNAMAPIEFTGLPGKQAQVQVTIKR